MKHPLRLVWIGFLLYFALGCAPPPPPSNAQASALISQFMENYMGLSNGNESAKPLDPGKVTSKIVIVDKLTIGAYDKVGAYFPVSADIFMVCRKSRDLKKTSEMTISLDKYTIPGNWKFKLKPMKNEEWSVDIQE